MKPENCTCCPEGPRWSLHLDGCARAIETGAPESCQHNRGCPVREATVGDPPKGCCGLTAMVEAAKD